VTDRVAQVVGFIELDNSGFKDKGLALVRFADITQNTNRVITSKEAARPGESVSVCVCVCACVRVFVCAAVLCVTVSFSGQRSPCGLISGRRLPDRAAIKQNVGL